MSKQSTSTTNAPRENRYEDGALGRFERNRFFNGKLMTARDMRADQRYHARRLHVLARGLAGEGVLEGLDVSVSGGEDALTVEIEAGVALDSYGRVVVVPRDRLVTVDDDPAVLNADRVSVFIEYDDCVKESVPISGAENACEERCAYNRVLEIYDVRVEPADPESPGKRVPSVEFPTRETVQDVDHGARAPDDPALATIAKTYARGSETDGSTDVFLGVFVDVDDESGAWSPDESSSIDRVYTNDMLYAAIARHTADFENPHQVTLRTGALEDNGASVGIEADERDDGDIAFDSADGTVAVSLRSGRVIDLSVDEYVGDVEAALAVRIDDVEADLETANDALSELGESVREADERIDAHERRAVEGTLQETALAFRTAANRFRAQRSEANAVSRLARATVDARLGMDSDEEATKKRVVRRPSGEFWFELSDDIYPELFERLATHLLEFADAVETDVTPRSYDRFDRALDRLRDAVGSGERIRLAAAQDDVCDAVAWLEPRTSRTFEPGVGVLDREDDDPDAAVVLRELSAPIDDWIVYGDETAARHNPDYDDEPVVIVSFERHLNEQWEGWQSASPETLFEGVQERGIKFYAFPRARLERLSDESSE